MAAISDAGAGFKSLRNAWADTTMPHGRLMLTILAGLAEFERELIRSRTSEERERAKSRGVRLGASRSSHGTSGARPWSVAKLASRWSRLPRSFEVSHSTISRLCPSRSFRQAASTRQRSTRRRTRSASHARRVAKRHYSRLLTFKENCSARPILFRRWTTARGTKFSANRDFRSATPTCLIR
ncbi:MAG: recombinase family protein [Pseudomonadota bacterium]